MKRVRSVSQVPGYEGDDRDSVYGMSRDGVCVSPFTDQVWCPLRASEDGEEGPSMRDEWPEKETDPSSPSCN
jgi:hypothetical protein